MAISARPSLSLQVQSGLQQQLLEGKYQVGEYLPNELTLSAQFNVSRTTIRDAVSALVEKGFLERQHGKGVLVIDKSQNVVTDSLRMLMMRGNYSVAEFMETRKLIEGQVAYFAAQRATQDEIRKMNEYVCKMERCGQDPDLYAQYDLNFHLALATAAQNRLLIAVISAIEPMLSGVVQHVVAQGGQVEGDAHFHRKIMEAVEARNPKQAQKCMYAHLEASEEMFEGGAYQDMYVRENRVMMEHDIQETIVN